MPITQERLEVILDAYDELLQTYNSMRFSISEMLRGLPKELHSNEQLAFITSLVAGPPIPTHHNIAMERAWFARFGRHNQRQREKMARRRARQLQGLPPSGLTPPSSPQLGPRREAPGQYTHQTLWVDPQAQADAEDQEGFDLDEPTPQPGAKP